MTRAQLLALLGAALLAGACVVLLLYRLGRQTRWEARVRAACRDPLLSPPPGRPKGGVFAMVISAIGHGLARSGVLSEKTVAGLMQTLNRAGIRGPRALELFVGSKLLLLVLLPLLAWAVLHRFELSPLLRNVLVAAAALVGLLGPDWWVGKRHKRYLAEVVRGLPDALDMMVICAEAGLGFEPAINRVAHEIHHAHPAIATEFGLTASEMRVASDTRLALLAMGTRTGLENVKRMTSMLAQTMQYGTPLGDALRVLSAEMRQEMLIRFETRAARLPVLLTIPMILFILPCLFLIVGGPAVIQVMTSFR